MKVPFSSVCALALAILCCRGTSLASDDVAIETDESSPTETKNAGEDPVGELWSWQPVEATNASPAPFDTNYVIEGKPSKAPAIAGWVLFAVAYLGSCMAGAALETGDNDAGWYMFIPVGGPIALGVHVGRDIYDIDDALVAPSILVSLLCSLPGIAQGIGLIIGSVGTSRLRRWKERTRLAVAPVGPDGAPGLTMTGFFF